MVRADDFSFWARRFFAGVPHRTLSHVWRHIVRGPLLYGARPYRTEVRHRDRAPAHDVFGLCSTAGARMVALFHLVAFQTHAAERDQGPRTSSCRRQFWRRSESPNFLERTGEGPPLLARCHLPIARRRRLALLHRYRLE